MVTQRVKQKGKEIVLVGTAHVSRQSVDEVRRVIRKEKPDAVAIELCEQRYKNLIDKDRWRNMRISKVIQEGKSYLFLANLILQNFQRKLGKKLGVEPGSEMLAAVKEAEKTKSEVEFVDRDIQITFKRAFSFMSFREKLRIFYALLFGLFETEIDEKEIENLKNKDVLDEAIKELSRITPGAKKVLIDERDRYIAEKLRCIKGRKVVAVVGAGHIEGIKKVLKGKKRVNIKRLEEVPEKLFKARYIGYLIPVFFAVIFLYAFLAKGIGTTLAMFGVWFLVNGTLAAIGTALAFGHPLSILTAFLAAPFTSLNPAIAAGWVAGYVEAKVRNPRVKDFENLGDLSSLKDFWKNQVTRILLVVVFANLGSTIGTFVALPYLLSLLA